MMSLMPRRRLGSVGDSAPPSESSEGNSSTEGNDTIGGSVGVGGGGGGVGGGGCFVGVVGGGGGSGGGISISGCGGDWSTHSTQTRSNVNSSIFINSSDLDGDDSSLSIETVSNNALSDYERGQVESFFSGLGTEVFVSYSLANLYEGCGKDGSGGGGGGGGGANGGGNAGGWRLVYTGIPAILYDRGSARSRSLPCVTLVLAERGSSFALWSDRIDNLSDYRVAGTAFHTMCLSTNHQQLIGMSFDCNEAAREMWARIEKLISVPANIALSVPGRKKAKQPKPAPLPPKSQISHPCQFQHVTSVTKDDTNRYYSMQSMRR